MIFLVFMLLWLANANGFVVTSAMWITTVATAVIVAVIKILE